MQIIVIKIHGRSSYYMYVLTQLITKFVAQFILHHTTMYLASDLEFKYNMFLNTCIAHVFKKTQFLSYAYAVYF